MKKIIGASLLCLVMSVIGIAIADDEGIFTWGFFMIGFPTETRREIWNTLKFAFTSKLHGAFFFIVIPHEGTELAQMCSEKFDIDSSFDADYHFSTSVISTLSGSELSFLQTIAFLGFFFDPRRIIRILRDYPRGISDLVKRFKGLSLYIFYEKPRLAIIKYLKARL